MACIWLKSSPSLDKGIAIINLLDDSRFDQFLRRILSKIKLQESEIFNDEEIQKLTKIFQVEQENLILTVKTLVYILKKLLKYIFMPLNLKSDLKLLGITNEKAEHIVKLWSTDTRTTLDILDSKSIVKTSDLLEFNWNLNAEVSSDYCKKTKVSKAYLSLSHRNHNNTIEVTHPELYSMYLQCESIQNELDNLGI